mmetsp:Transcript_38/g.56  ORF Transcript_38/g.56 Transcript_38/m.56 type:complete len:260 (+) Transcript_38:91-870(+)
MPLTLRTLTSIIVFFAISTFHISLSFSIPTRNNRPAFGISNPSHISKTKKCPSNLVLYASTKKQRNSLQKLPETETKQVPFIDSETESFIECFIDSVATLDEVEYAIGAPCDYSVALCYFEDDDQLVPIELDEELMDEVFPIAERIVEDEFGDELMLQRTPQTLTLVGELEEDEDENEDDILFDDDSDAELEEEVEILLSFEHNDAEFHLVRLLDPVLLVGKAHPDGEDKRFLLTPEESDKVMPELEEIFLAYQDVDDI